MISSDREPFLALGPAPGLDRARFADRQQLFVIPNVARVCARLAEDEVGMLGFFEAQNDPDAVRVLLGEGARWLREHGATRVIGPIDGDTWHRYRVNAGSFETPRFLLEPWNPEYYASLWESAGFTIAETYTSKRVDDIAPLTEQLAPMHKRSLDRGYRFRTLDPARLNDEFARVWEISCAIFRENAFYAGISLDEFLALYAGIDRLLVPELVIFAEAPDGDTVGFLFAYPDTAPGVVDYKTIGVLPQHRRGHVGWAMLHRAYSAALALGRNVANHCLMREGNASQSMDAGHATTFRTYLLYDLDCGDRNRRFSTP
ncbi:MAG TPA: GNAT family N-acetyltransferase, partial [Thermoanaerobaculia bacterium]|nr:GNAT family N-acetyltransferase [Thermoanaerobaculia bacterium]